MAFSLSPSVEVREFDLSISIPNLPSAKTGMILRADTGQCNKIIPVTSEADLISNFGKPTAANYQDWFQAWNFLQYASSLYVVRPMNADVKNSAIFITGDVASPGSKSNFYNTDVAEQELTAMQSFASTEKLTFINKNTTSKQDLAVAVCSSNRFWEQPFANEFYGIVTLDGSGVDTLNEIGGLTTPSQYVNLLGGNTLVAGSKFVANSKKLFTVTNTYDNKVKLNATISASDLSRSYGKVVAGSTPSGTEPTPTIKFNTTDFNVELYAIFKFGANLYYATSVNTETGVVNFKAISGDGTGYIAPSVDDVIYSNSEYYFFQPSADYIDSDTEIIIEQYTSVIKVEEGFNWEEGKSLKLLYNGTDKYTGNLNDLFTPNEDGTNEHNYVVIAVDTLNNTITLDRPLSFPIVLTTTASALVSIDDVVSIYPAIRGINLYSTVFDNNLITKSSETVFDQGNGGNSLVVVKEKLAKFSNFLEYEPEWLQDEFVTVILKKNNAGLYEFVESKLASYRPSARDYQNRNIFGNEVFYYTSKYIYCNVALDETIAKVDTAETPTVKFVEDLGTTQMVNGDTIVESYGTVYPLKGVSVNGNFELELSSIGTVQYDAANFSVADIQNAQNMFNDAENFDVNILITHAFDMNGMSTIAESRRDCVSIVAPYEIDSIVGKSASNATLYMLEKYGAKTVDTQQKPVFSTYGTYSSIYGNMKYQYDKFNDVNRWICISGDIAGLYAQTDKNRDPWWAPAGIDRGKIKNAIKLAFNPNKQNRDDLYVNSINPVMSIAGEGNAVVFGQKTATAKPSALDRVNVRRLMIVIEKAVSTAVKYSIFEFNDAFTRSRLVGMIDPFLRTVKARRGVYDYYVQCDSVNNPASVLDANGLVIDVYVKPTRVAEFIVVNFNILRSDANISEFIGGAGA